GTWAHATPGRRISQAESVTTATAPAAIALSINLLPSLDSPRMATKTSPGRTRRESYSTPLTLGLPRWDNTSAPSRSCRKFIDWIILQRCVAPASGRLSRTLHPLWYQENDAGRFRHVRGRSALRFHRSNLTSTRVPAPTCDPATGDCSRAMPLPTTSSSSPPSCAASMAPRTVFPMNEGTAIPPCSTSRTTVPLEDNFVSAARFGGCSVSLETVVPGTTPLSFRAAGTTMSAGAGKDFGAGIMLREAGTEAGTVGLTSATSRAALK